MKLIRFPARLFLFLSLFLAACGTLQVTVDQSPAVPAPSRTPAVAATPSPSPAATATATRAQSTSPTSAAAITQTAVFYDAHTGFLLGGVEAGRWLSPTVAVTLLQGNERYQFYDGGSRTAEAVGTVTTVDSPICSGLTLDFVREPAVSWALAVARATWDLTPYPPEEATLDPEQRQAVETFLREQGLHPEPGSLALEQAQRVDLEGDGSPELVVTAARLLEDGRMPPVAAGDYALVAVIREDNSVLPVVVDLYPEAQSLAYPWRYHLAAILDLNGDGRQELVVTGTRYEGRRTHIFEIGVGEAISVLNTGCPPPGIDPSPPAVAAERPAATATTPPVASERPTATPTPPVVLVPPDPPKPSPTPDAHIATFSVEPTRTFPGGTVTVTWEATGTAARLCLQVPTVGGQVATRGCEPVPLSGSQPYPLDPQYRDRVLLALEVENGQEVANASLPVDLLCPDAWWYLENPPEICPATDPFRSLAAAQSFQMGQMIWIEDPGVYYVLFDDGSFQTIYDPLQIVEDEEPPIEEPPAGLQAPVSGFGLLWRGQVANTAGLRERLGWALAPEYNFEAVWQAGARPDHARVFLQGPDGQVLLLHLGLNRWEVWQ